MKTPNLLSRWLLLSLVLLFPPAGRAQSTPPPLPTPADILNIWTFDNGPLWTTESGDAPSSFTNLTIVSGWAPSGTALQVDTNEAAWLNYGLTNADGSTNLTFPAGAFMTWYAPDFTSLSGGGSGPGEWANLFTVGNFTPDAAVGCWSLAIDPAGTNLVFIAQTNSASQLVFNTPIEWSAGDWHFLTVSYTPTNCALYLEGQLITNAPPIQYWPSAAEAAQDGIWVGSTKSGDSQGHGIFQYLVTFNYAVDSNFVSDLYQRFSSEIASWGGNLPPISLGPGRGSGAQSAPAPPGSGGTNGGVTFHSSPQPTYVVTTNYANYTNFWLTISNSPTKVYVTIQSTLSNLTYEILTNNSSLALTNWGVWTNLVASNSVTRAQPMTVGTNAVVFKGQLVSSSTTNGLLDWWCMQYFHTLVVSPYADPDGDGLCNWDECYISHSNPTNAHTFSTNHTDSQAWLLAYTNDPACIRQLALVNGPGTNLVTLTLSNTVVGSVYQIYSKNTAGTNYPWIVETNFLGTNTYTKAVIALNGRSLSFVGGYAADDDSDGLPDGYEVLATHTDPYLYDTGLTGTNDGYKDPDGDGWVNLQEYYNGTDPLVFNPPASVQNLYADFGSGGSSLVIGWQAPAKPVQEYVLVIHDNVLGTISNTIAAGQTVFTYNHAATNVSEIDLYAIYAGGTSLVSRYTPPASYSGGLAALVHGPHGHCYLVANTNIPGLAKFQIGIQGYTSGLQENYFNPFGAYGSSRFGDAVQPFPFPVAGSGLPDTNLTLSISITNLTNGIYQIPNSVLPLYAGYSADSPNWTALRSDGTPLPFTPEDYYNNVGAVPFIDCSAAMRQNAAFLLRIASSDPLECYSYSYPWYAEFTYPSTYAFSSYYIYDSSIDAYAYDPLAPIEDNYFFRNLVFDSTRVNGQGYLLTGFAPGEDNSYYQYTNLALNFPSYNYAAYSNTAPIVGLLASNATQWVGFESEDFSSFGAYTSGSSLYMTNSTNAFGLSYQSLKVALTSGSLATLAPGSPVSQVINGTFYYGTAQPALQTVSYYFARVDSGSQPIPENQGYFTNSLTTQPIATSVGAPIQVAGYAKEKATNGNPNIFAYVGQYFTNAYVMSGTNVTTNTTGILSEYGEFFPTAPGKISLATMPDPTQTNRQGQCEVDVIRLSLDVNHDGTMDETFTGPDVTTAANPFVFWINNDFDRWAYTILDGNVEDDVQSNSVYASSPYQPTLSVPDCQYRTSSGQRVIPCVRDLEDYTRLWVSGASNAVSRLPSGSSVILSWSGDYSYTNIPTIDIFQAADADGGTSYLTNFTTASNQINGSLCKYVGRLGPSNIVLSSSSYSHNWAGDHYIFCGVAGGYGQLNLTVLDQNNDVLAQSSQYIQIQDIKAMYERWTVGDNDGNVTVNPATVAQIVHDDEPSGEYSYDPVIDTNLDYVLFVHGYNMAAWEKDRYAETSYKRLYWQGYKGRFGSLRWPTYNRFTAYDTSEAEAWNSASGLQNLLTNLNRQYPGNIYVLAHSMGNVVTGEALHRVGTNEIVNTYVASQAAISARAYDNTLPADLTNAYYFNVKTPDSEGHYYTNGAPSYLGGIGGAEKFIDFFNSQDWALGKWCIDQAAKPDAFYQYGTPSSNFPSGYYYAPSPFTTVSLVFTNNTYQIFSRCVQSYSFTLGAETNLVNPFPFSLSVNLQSEPYNFLSTHPGHSEQFRFDNMTTTAYWKQLLSSFGIEP